MQWNILKTPVLILLVSSSASVLAAPKLQLSDMSYVGAFRVTLGTYGESRVNWSNGKIVVSPETGTFFLNGSDGYSIAEFNIPELSTSEDLNNLLFTGPPIQDFVDLSARVETGNPQSLDNITGMRVVGDKLVVNGVEYYDAPGDNYHTTLVVENAFDLANSEVNGFIKLEGRAHSAGWLTPIPLEYQEVFSADFIAGYSSVFAINGRNSMGPSAFALNIQDLASAAADEDVSAKALIDYSLGNPLTDKAPYNFVDGVVTDNDLWTEVSKAHFGMIVPGTSTYFTIGSSGGHETGAGYKITQDDGNGRQCGGPCPFYSTDDYNHAWLFDVEDMIAVNNGDLTPHSVRPYSYGKINVEFEDIDNDGVTSLISSADYDSVNDLLYVVLNKGDNLQSNFDPAPLILVYRLGVTEKSSTESSSIGMCTVASK